jgi:16S rRNA (uracil1498-N3)-methyltransferase
MTALINVLTAMKRQTISTKLNETVTFKEFLKRESEGLQLIAHCEETDENIEI